MCIGQPMLVISIHGDAAVCEGATQRIDLRLTPDAVAGDWLLVFLGAARRVISEAEALAIADALGALQAASDGEPLGGYFPDLNGSPSLSEHMEAARRTGAKAV